MSFVESPRFPDRIGYLSVGGPTFRTAVVETNSGAEYRNARWAQSLRRYDLAHSGRTQAEIDELLAFFLAVGQGRAHMFRFRDWADYRVTVTDGRLELGAGTGEPTYQLAKAYAAGAYTHYRDITKPVAGSVACYRNAGLLTVGAGAGNIAIDTTTGLITFVADASQAIASHTPGATHVFTTAADISGLSIGSKVYLTGIVGTAAASLNAIAHTISNKTGSGPYTWTLSTATTGLTVSSNGTAAKFPQASDALTWAGSFDVPVRFDVDEFPIRIEGPGIYTLDTLPLVERRV